MPSRRKQIEALQAKAGELAEEVDALVADMQDALDNMPEGIRDGANGDTARDRMEMLENWSMNLTEMAEEDVE